MTQDPNPRMSREALATRAFVELADSLVEDFDVIDLLTVLTRRSVDLLEAAAAGILLGDSNGRLRVAAASDERIELLELFQIQNDEGPCLDSYRSGRQIAHPDLGDDSPWPRFAAESVRNGFPSVCALPLRRKDAVLGCLNLFMAEPTQLSVDDVALAQALADVASVTIAQYQTHRSADLRATQLQIALNSRVLIEQAKGILAERGQIDMDEAFTRLRDYARANQLLLTDVASALVAGILHIDTVADIDT
jgi:transcriptional regulator with GAF, ATPase, and Fis domain